MTVERSWVGVVYADYHQFVVGDPDRDPGEWAHPSTGVADPGLGEGLYVHTGVQSGQVHYEVIVYDAEPAGGSDSWEDVVEITTDASAPWHVQGWGGASFDPEPLFDAPGRYTIRCSLRGRDTEPSQNVDLAREKVCLEVWLTHRAPGVDAVKITSDFGKQFRQQTL